MSEVCHSGPWWKSRSSRNRSTLDAPAPFKGPLLFRPAACCHARCWARVTSSSNFIKSKFSWETSSFLNIKNWFKNHLNTSAAGFCPQLPSCNPFRSRNLNYFHHGRCVRTKPPDFPTCRPVQETKSIEYNEHLPLPNKTAHTQLRRGYLIVCPQGWASQDMVSSHTFSPTSTQQPLTCCHLSLFPLNPVWVDGQVMKINV